MNREEILEKSRKEKTDEGLSTAQSQGSEIGITALWMITFFISIFNQFNGISNDAPTAMFFACGAAKFYPVYKFTKKKSYIALVVVFSIISIFSLVRHVITTLG